MRPLRLAVPILVTALVLAAAISHARAAAGSAGAGAGPRVIATVPADRMPTDDGASAPITLEVRVHVEPNGLADSARALSGPANQRAAAEAAARWYVFEPTPKGGWTTVTVVVAPAPPDEEPLTPDFIAEAHAAETNGDLRGALDWWLGALARVGTHASLRDPWAIREQVLRLANAMHPQPPVPNATHVNGMGLSAQLERTVARGQHQDLVGLLEPVILEAPWWAEPYRCLAAAQCGCGRLADARRTLRFYRMAADSAGRVRAESALRLLAAADTVGACEVLKKQPMKPETEPGE